MEQFKKRKAYQKKWFGDFGDDEAACRQLLAAKRDRYGQLDPTDGTTVKKVTITELWNKHSTTGGTLAYLQWIRRNHSTITTIADFLAEHMKTSIAVCRSQAVSTKAATNNHCSSHSDQGHNGQSPPAFPWPLQEAVHIVHLVAKPWPMWTVLKSRRHSLAAEPAVRIKVATKFMFLAAQPTVDHIILRYNHLNL